MLRTLGLVAVLAAAVAAPAAAHFQSPAHSGALKQAGIAAYANFACNPGEAANEYTFYMQSDCVADTVASFNAPAAAPVALASAEQ